MSTWRERFQILSEIGEGGFAKVFRARELSTGRRAAVKVLKDAYLKDTEVVERFRREVFAVASISSPHVVGMHDFGITGDEVWIAMEYVEGNTLREVIYDRAWSAHDIHLIVGQIAQALSSAHRQDIVHRDLKPENVMLVPAAGGARTVKVLDFGLAKLAMLERKLELEPLTRAGMCFGTPQYMAPELIQGKPFDKSVDLYALGVIAFELVAGMLPWDGSDPRQVLLSVVKNPPPHITRALHASVQRVDEIDAFLQRALSKDRSKRPATAEEFFKEFEFALFGSAQPTVARNVPPGESAFGSVWAVSLDLRTNGEDSTEIDGHAGRIATPIELQKTSASGVRKRRLNSGWMQNLDETVDESAKTLESIDVSNVIPLVKQKPDDDSDPRRTSSDEITSPRLGKKVAAAALAMKPPAPAPAPTAETPNGGSSKAPKPTTRTDLTEMIRTPAGQKRLVVWLVPLLVGFVVFAAALGYFLGQRSR